MKNIFFWENSDEFGCFSNFWPGPYVIEGKEWPTTEHYFAAMKTLDPVAQEKIRKAVTPGLAKKLGREVVLRDDWDQIKYDVMLTALRAKFGDLYPVLKDKLISTGESDIYEDSPYDHVWGTGRRGSIGNGQNLLGKALMQVRDELKKV
jgi:N-glycosidase YbiA